MVNRLKQRAIVLVLFFLLSLVTPLSAEQKVSVAIYPFGVEADAPDGKLGKTIPLMLADQLKESGATVVIIEDDVDTSQWTPEEFKGQGIKMGVDQIITGQIFTLGQRMSIDATMYPVYGDDVPMTLFAQSSGKASTSIASAVEQLKKGVVGELFEKRIISSIRVAGNRRIESDAILRVITSEPQEIMVPSKLSQDLQKIYKMGFFENVVIRKKSLDRGLEITFEVTEKPTVRYIKFSGNHVYEEEELFDVVDTSTGSILNVYKINADVDKLRRLYTEKNYHNVQIAYNIDTVKNRQADIQFDIKEGEKLKIESITFEGNRHFDKDDLADVMKVQEKGFWSFLTSSGDLDETELENDVIRIESLYKNNGFINVKVSDPEIAYNEESITVKFKIEEGFQYSVGKVDIEGDILGNKEDLLEDMRIKKGGLFNREELRTDLLRLNDKYANEGYANAKVVPLVDKNNETKIVDIRFKVTQGEMVYFNRINISGNTKTRDKVIRREMAVKEQGKYSLAKIQRSYRNLRFKDYFEVVDIKPTKTDVANQRNLEVTVKEKATGNFAFGGGFNSGDGPFGQVSLEERNLFGKGYNLKLMARLSGETGLYNISFTEPWLFDKPISLGGDIYKLEKEYDHYDRDSIGFTIRNAYRQIWDYTSLGVEYNLEQFEVSDVDVTKTSVTPGKFLTASLKPYISYDSRNHYFLPTKGSFHKFSIEYAGEVVGGEIDYTKYLAETGVWVPMFWKFTGALHLKGGYLDDRTDGNPDIDWARFYLGGINSIRGFDDADDINATPDGSSIQRGGEKFIQFNAEMIFPIEEKMGVMGVLFYDRGDVYRASEDIDLGSQFSSAGFEVRWNSPMGPIRLAYGLVLDGQDKKKAGDGQFDFSIGAFF
ncbi:MAG: outer membrane protein assembly factor BamA [Desulfobacterales bacterium]|nr:outer membrane protein assembly factor BamA [Desulfobacterales bacterium]